MLPKRRLENITAQELPDETLIHDGGRNKVHCLNRTSSLVWKHCDGATSVVELVRRMREQFQVADADAVVRLALEQLARRHLLEGADLPAAPATAAARISRRDALKKFAVAAAAALPIVLTITPKASASFLVSASVGCPQGTTPCSRLLDRFLCCQGNENCVNANCVPKPTSPPQSPPPPPPPPVQPRCRIVGSPCGPLLPAGCRCDPATNTIVQA